MSDLVKSDKFRDLLRMFNTNIEGKRTAELALTGIMGVGRRFSRAILKIANIPHTKRCGEITPEEEKLLSTIIADPITHGLPVWMVNHQKEMETGKSMHLNSNMFSQQMRNELERLRRAKCNRGIRHSNKLKVRGQRTKCTGRRAGVVGVVRKTK